MVYLTRNAVETANTYDTYEAFACGKARVIRKGIAADDCLELFNLGIWYKAVTLRVFLEGFKTLKRSKNVVSLLLPNNSDTPTMDRLKIRLIGKHGEGASEGVSGTCV